MRRVSLRPHNHNLFGLSLGLAPGNLFPQDLIRCINMLNPIVMCLSLALVQSVVKGIQSSRRLLVVYLLVQIAEHLLSFSQVGLKPINLLLDHGDFIAQTL
jgi:hypothetical protein